ncbi:MAG: MFS transporter [Gammaproteobacteria bacterium RIFCSPHIGHO2_12_FULL_41_15]|nr:MAG: MFS transporter [Gammaproteobacteria bacterium RIFCSPHIGHO2_12_FULL_41_15]
MQAAFEKRAVLSLAAIMAFRILGLFMILPVFSLYAKQFTQATPFLIGVALGIYGLTQALLQIPFGSLSDKIGRKPMIAIGLILFAIGSIVGAYTTNIYTLILARAIQGGGAVGSTILALVADLTRDENRTKAMAIIGLNIGFAFTIALVLGPLINTYYHLSGIFYVSLLMAVLGLVLLFTVVPKAPKLVFHENIESRGFRHILKDKQLLRLNYGIAAQHATLTAMFMAIPILLSQVAGVSLTHAPLLYLFVTVVSFILMLPFVIIGEKQRKIKPIFCAAIFLMMICQLALILFHHNIYEIAIILLLYFTAFTLLEAFLPSLISKTAPIRQKGAAMGVYSTSQFLGIFLGGLAGGFFFEYFGATSVFVFSSIATGLWFLLALSMQHPPYLSTLIFKLPENFTTNMSKWLKQQKGVADIAAMPDEKLLYLKIDKQVIKEPVLRELIEQGKLPNALNHSKKPKGDQHGTWR